MTARPVMRAHRTGPILQVAVGESAGLEAAGNDEIVRLLHGELSRMAAAGELSGGGPLGICGPMSLPGMVTIAHAVLHLFSAVAVFDPKLPGFVVAASHDRRFPVGQILTADELRTAAPIRKEDAR